MYTIRFAKFDNGAFIAHTDILRNLNRTFRRASVDVNYSKGFNRHMSLKLTQPLPFGVASEGEWVTADIDLDYEPKRIIELFNAHCPPFLRGIEAYKVDKNPNLGGKVTASSYRIDGVFNQELKAGIESVTDGFEVKYIDKDGNEASKEYGKDIIELEVKDDALYITLPFGNYNLRIDLLAQQLNKSFGTDISIGDITRVDQYVRTEEGLIEAGAYLRSLS